MLCLPGAFFARSKTISLRGLDDVIPSFFLRCGWRMAVNFAKLPELLRAPQNEPSRVARGVGEQYSTKNFGMSDAMRHTRGQSISATTIR
jgi:hypothetical protein